MCRWQRNNLQATKFAQRLKENLVAKSCRKSGVLGVPTNNRVME